MATKQQLTDLALEALADGSFHIASKLAAMARDVDAKPAVKLIPKPAQLELRHERPMATVDDIRKTIDHYLRSYSVGVVFKYVDIAGYVQGVLSDSLDFSMTNETTPRLKWRRQVTHYIAVLRDSGVLDIEMKGSQRYVMRRHP